MAPNAPPPAAFGNDAGGFADAEETQHGRKFTAKRRQLPENGGPDTPPEESADMSMPASFENTAPVNVPVDAPVEQPQFDESADIQFGRGRR